MGKRPIQPDSPSPLLLQSIILDCEIPCCLNGCLGLGTGCRVKINGAEDVADCIQNVCRGVPFVAIIGSVIILDLVLALAVIERWPPVWPHHLSKLRKPPCKLLNTIAEIENRRSILSRLRAPGQVFEHDATIPQTLRRTSPERLVPGYDGLVGHQQDRLGHSLPFYLINQFGYELIQQRLAVGRVEKNAEST